MHNLVRQHVMYVWIAMLGVLFSALAPALSHAMAAPRADEQVQVCTMAGMKTVVLAKAPSGKSVLPDHFANHCAYCATHGGMNALLPMAPCVFALPAASPSYPPLLRQAAKPLFAWTAAKPRGPPARV